MVEAQSVVRAKEAAVATAQGTWDEEDEENCTGLIAAQKVGQARFLSVSACGTCLNVSSGILGRQVLVTTHRVAETRC